MHGCQSQRYLFTHIINCNGRPAIWFSDTNTEGSLYIKFLAQGQIPINCHFTLNDLCRLYLIISQARQHRETKPEMLLNSCFPPFMFWIMDFYDVLLQAPTLTNAGPLPYHAICTV